MKGMPIFVGVQKRFLPIAPQVGDWLNMQVSWITCKEVLKGQIESISLFPEGKALICRPSYDSLLSSWGTFCLWIGNDGSGGVIGQWRPCEQHRIAMHAYHSHKAQQFLAA